MTSFDQACDRIRTTFSYRLTRFLRGAPVSIALRRPVISFCFDDFPKSAAPTGARILENANVRGTYYFSATLAGRVVDGVRQYDRKDLLELSNAGHELGCHTFDHTPVRNLSSRELDRQISFNKRFLSSTGCESDLQSFAYPYGDVGLASRRHLAGYFAACRGVWAGINGTSADLALLKSVCLEPHILARTSATYWIERARNVGGWLIFTTHDIDDNHTRFGVSPRYLESVVNSAIASGARILPVSQALSTIREECSTTTARGTRQLLRSAEPRYPAN